MILFERTNTYDLYDGRVWKRGIAPSDLPTVLESMGIDPSSVDDIEPLHADAMHVLAEVAYLLDDHLAEREAGRWIDQHLRPARRALKRSPYSLKHDATTRHIAESAFIKLLTERGLYHGNKIFACLM